MLKNIRWVPLLRDVQVNKEERLAILAPDFAPASNFSYLLSLQHSGKTCLMHEPGRPVKRSRRQVVWPLVHGSTAKLPELYDRFYIFL